MCTTVLMKCNILLLFRSRLQKSGKYRLIILLCNYFIPWSDHNRIQFRQNTNVSVKNVHRTENEKCLVSILFLVHFSVIRSPYFCVTTEHRCEIPISPLSLIFFLFFSIRCSGSETSNPSSLLSLTPLPNRRAGRIAVHLAFQTDGHPFDDRNSKTR